MGAGRIFALAFLSVWLKGWVLGEYYSSRELLMWATAGGKPPQSYGPSGGEGLPLLELVWLTGWSIGGILAGWTWYAALCAAQEIRATHAALSIRRLPLGWRREYPIAAVGNLRPFHFAHDKSLHGWFWLNTALCFEYGRRKVRFGTGLTDDEAQQLVGLLRGRMPFPS